MANTTDQSLPAAVPSSFKGSAPVRDPLLPRFAWPSRLTYLRVIMQAKQRLDRQEKS